MQHSSQISDINSIVLSKLGNKHSFNEGYLLRTSKLNEASYTLFTSTLKYSVKCFYPQGNLPQIEDNKVCEIRLSKFSFDFLITERTKKDLQYNIIILIYDYEIGKSRNDISTMIKQNFPMNINYNRELIEEMNIKFNKLLQGMIKEYSILFGNISKFNANDFITKNFSEDYHHMNNHLNLFEICKCVIQRSAEGYLLLNRIGLDFPNKYIEDPNKTSSIEWKNLIYSAPTMKAKIEENDNKVDSIFNPTPVEIKNYNGKNLFTALVNNINDKTKIPKEKNVEDNDNIPKRIKELIGCYGNINMHIGHSLVEKYKLYKQYNEVNNSI